MAYDGLVYTYPDGSKGGVPYDFWQTYMKNRHLYEQLGKPTPMHYVTTKEPDGSVWTYGFSYANPFSYETSRQESAPMYEEAGSLYDRIRPPEEGTPVVTEPIVVSEPSPPAPPVAPGVTEPGGYDYPAAAAGVGVSDLVGVGLLGLVARGLGMRRFRKRKK